MWRIDSCAMGLSAESASESFSAPVPADPIGDFVHDLNNRLLVIRAHTTLALTALDNGDAVAGNAATELRCLLDVVDDTTAASRTFRLALTASAT